MGGLRFRRSMQLSPGVRMSITKTGLGISMGGLGFRYSVHTSGRTTATVGLPGTGLSYSHSSGGGRPRSSARHSNPRGSSRVTEGSGQQESGPLHKPGLFASKSEKHLYKGLRALLSDDTALASTAFADVLNHDPRVTSAHLFAAVASGLDSGLPEAIRHLEFLLSSHEPFPDPVLVRCLQPTNATVIMSLRITQEILAEVPLSLAAAALFLAEAYQRSNRLPEAIGLVMQLHAARPNDTTIRLSMADLLFADHDDEGVVEACRDLTNVDDLTAAAIRLRARSLFVMGHLTASFVSFNEALKSSRRDPALLAGIRYDRALAYERAGEPARAKADYERIFAIDPDYKDIRHRLAALAPRRAT